MTKRTDYVYQKNVNIYNDNVRFDIFTSAISQNLSSNLVYIHLVYLVQNECKCI